VRLRPEGGLGTARESVGDTMRDLAARIGINASTVCLAESGKPVSTAHFMALCAAGRPVAVGLFQVRRGLVTKAINSSRCWSSAEFSGAC
jgi:transcriptional regulator with XRE-family HTH domain